jgi:ABC-2 type transport system ATP-binding protein
MQFHAILYGISKDVYEERIQKLLTLVELWDRKDSFVKTFSGGMKRRLEIARGLLHHPKVLFLDEPTIGLDPQTRNLMWNYIYNLNKEENVTIFFTTHHMEEVQKMAQKIAIIDHGKIIAHGTPDEIRKNAGTEDLEEAFIKITGREVREDKSDFSKQMMRNSSRMMR